MLAPSCAESFGGPRASLGSFFFPAFRRRGGFERTEKANGDRRDLIHGVEERTFIRLGRFVEAANFPHELQGSGANFVGSDGRIKIVKGSDISAHGGLTSKMIRESPPSEGRLEEVISLVRKDLSLFLIDMTDD
jgi:hypothetical protein